ncbi:MAG: tRNA (adenosine(37)-N6)-threonylcarbamoyltransferase complex transferase subunit TsaD [Alphaproteobacteria bacterium]|nr:tRNA (adenosine(37)-N6)-threonylcarbamoyltransferase complex transferase subunit TsaD [Alphaproteobacteria bacterium]
MKEYITILGLESSCDDTAASVVRCARAQCADIMSSVVYGQTELHADFGGIVPEIAARAHAEKLDYCVEEALSRADLSLKNIDAIAVTAGPGLIGGVLSGVMCAKGLSAGAKIPLIGVNHLAGHGLTPRLTNQLAYPYLLLLVSGGHCQFLIVRSFDEFTRLGGTIDDAPGEAFDKTARLLGLSQPGGPAVERAAKGANPRAFKFPRPLLDRPGCDMSFSGLKTALRRARDQLVEKNNGLTLTEIGELSAGFQAAVCDVLVEKSRRAMRLFSAEFPTVKPALAVAGGVAANKAIRAGLLAVCEAEGFDFVAPPPEFCTDNAAMIAWVGVERFRAGKFDDSTLSARPRWPLDNHSRPMLGSGKKGTKA